MRTHRDNPYTYTDFNPANRNPDDFGYSPVKDALHNVFRSLGLTAPLTYPRGIDSSHWTIENIKDWGEVAKTIVLFYTKSTEGISYQDIDSQLGALEAKAAGLITLFFHFFRRNLNGTSQFNYFKSKTESLILQIGGEKVVIVDMETLDGVPNSMGNLNFKLFCNAAHAENYKVGLYVNPSQWVTFGLGSWTNGFVDFCLLAHWKAGNSPDKPPGIDPAKIAAQQEGVLGLHSWIQPIPGLIPQMDCNLLLWPLAQWEMFTGQTYSPDTPPIEPPPPDPIGEPDMQFIAKTIVNIRPSPTTSAKDIGNVPLNALIVALAMKLYSGGSFWVKFTPLPEWLTETALEYWACLEINGGNILMDYSPTPPPAPVPVTLRQTMAKTNLAWYKETNAQGKPIMAFPPPSVRPQFDTGTVVACDPAKVDADGTVDYYRVLNGEHATPKTYLPSAGYTGWFVSAAETFEI